MKNRDITMGTAELETLSRYVTFAVHIHSDIPLHDFQISSKIRASKKLIGTTLKFPVTDSQVSCVRSIDSSPKMSIEPKLMQRMYIVAVLTNLWERVTSGKNPTKDGKDMFHELLQKQRFDTNAIQDSAGSIRCRYSRKNLTADAIRHVLPKTEIQFKCNSGSSQSICRMYRTEIGTEYRRELLPIRSRMYIRSNRTAVT